MTEGNITTEYETYDAIFECKLLLMNINDKERRGNEIRYIVIKKYIFRNNQNKIDNNLKDV